MKDDVRVEDSTYLISLVRLTGRQIKDIHGYIDDPYDIPSFKLTAVILQDGTEIGVDGEHHFPYLYPNELANLGEDYLAQYMDD